MLHRNIDAGSRHARPRSLTLSTGASAVADRLIDFSYAFKVAFEIASQSGGGTLVPDREGRTSWLE
jgi:hypothetical protein